MIRFFFTLILTMAVTMVVAQPAKQYSIKDKRAIKDYEEILDLYQVYNLKACEERLTALIKKHPDFAEPQFLLGQVYGEQGQFEKGIPFLEAGLKIDPKTFPIAWYQLAESNFALGRYSEAEKAISTFIPFPRRDADIEKRAQVILSSCVFAKEALAHPVPFEPMNLGNGVNTALNEYFPCVTADENTLLFTRRIKDNRAFGGEQEDFYISEKSEGQWKTAQAIQSINTDHNEGAPSLSADGQTLIFTACETADGSWGGDRAGLGSCDLFYSMRTPDGWSPAKNLGRGINTPVWESQPSYSADGRTLYFIRGKRTAHGISEQDIYYSYINDQNQWSIPQKVPGQVNTIFEEESVMIHPDGRTLYFSSNGHAGMGGQDIYMSRLLPNGDWGKPLNLGYPINTYKDENSITVTAKGEIALFASNKEGGYGGLDLYSFVLPERDRPTLVTYVSGIISDQLSFKKLEAHLELIDLATGKVITESYSAPGKGSFLLCIPGDRDYALNVSKEGYLFHSENFSLKNYKSIEPYKLDIKLQKLKPGARIVLKNIFFDNNQATLKEESRIELDRLVALLNANPDRTVEIGGHTDNVGSDESNMTLSNARAQSVVEYLTKHGISASRLTAKGYGESSPIDTNETELGRANNRRTEFTLTN